ncbi:MAG: chemotaxis protein CheW [Geobacter sp.]|nr:chemotaxis protein CheW [Geobacter sp.]
METGIQELQLAGFRLGDNLFAIDIMRIKEILTPQKLSGFPVQHDALDGMINLRGQVIPVLNLRARFGMPPRPTGPGKLIIISVAGRLVALAVDDLDEVFSVTAGDLRPPPDMVSDVGAELLIAVCLWNDQMYLVLHIDELFRDGGQQTLQRREWAVW